MEADTESAPKNVGRTEPKTRTRKFWIPNPKKSTKPIGAELPFTGPHRIGRGYRAILATAPGITIIAEAKSGAILGDNLEAVRKSVIAGDPKLIRLQVKAAVRQRARVEILPPDRFWDYYNQSPLKQAI